MAAMPAVKAERFGGDGDRPGGSFGGLGAPQPMRTGLDPSLPYGATATAPIAGHAAPGSDTRVKPRMVDLSRVPAPMARPAAQSPMATVLIWVFVGIGALVLIYYGVQMFSGTQLGGSSVNNQAPRDERIQIDEVQALYSVDSQASGIESGTLKLYIVTAGGGRLSGGDQDRVKVHVAQKLASFDSAARFFDGGAGEYEQWRTGGSHIRLIFYEGYDYAGYRTMDFRIE